jgi:hypothetical protein
LRRFSQNGYYELALGIIAKSVSLPDEDGGLQITVRNGRARAPTTTDRFAKH